MLKSIYFGLTIFIRVLKVLLPLWWMIRWSTSCSLREAGEHNGCTWHRFDPTLSPCWGWTWRLCWWIWSDHHADGKQDGCGGDFGPTIFSSQAIFNGDFGPTIFSSQAIFNGDFGPTIFSSQTIFNGDFGPTIFSSLAIFSKALRPAGLRWWPWSDYFQFTGEHGGYDGDFATTVFSLLVNMTIVVVTLVRLFSVYWWTWRLWWWHVSDYLQFTGEHGDCSGDFGTIIFSLLVNMAFVMVTCARLSSVYWWTWRLWWWLWYNYLQFTGEHGGCAGDICTTIFSLLVNMAAVVVTLVRLSSVC